MNNPKRLRVHDSTMSNRYNNHNNLIDKRSDISDEPYIRGQGGFVD